MEFNDWNGRGKDSLTTPGGPFQPPAGSGRRYEYDRADAPRRDAPVRPRARTAETVPAAQAASPFAPAEAPRPWYAETEEAARREAAPVVLSHDGARLEASLEQEGPGPVYTVRLPAQPKPAPAKGRSLWWVAPALLAALLLGVLLGAWVGPLLRDPYAPSAAPTAPVPGDAESAATRIYRQCSDAVLSVRAFSASSSSAEPTASAGTGFLIRSDGCFLTNAHVVEGMELIGVTLRDGRKFSAELLFSDPDQDLALLRIDAADLPCLELGDSDALEVGDWICTIGNPTGELGSSLTTGYLSAGPRQVQADGRTLTMLQINAAVNKGNSGGPLLDQAGRVVGIVTAKLSASGDAPVEGLGFALPINGVKATVQSWLAQESGQPAP